MKSKKNLFCPNRLQCAQDIEWISVVQMQCCSNIPRDTCSFGYMYQRYYRGYVRWRGTWKDLFYCHVIKQSNWLKQLLLNRKQYLFAIMWFYFEHIDIKIGLTELLRPQFKANPHIGLASATPADRWDQLCRLANWGWLKTKAACCGPLLTEICMHIQCMLGLLFFDAIFQKLDWASSK